MPILVLVGHGSCGTIDAVCVRVFAAGTDGSWNQARATTSCELRIARRNCGSGETGTVRRHACKRIWRVCSSVCTLPNHSKLVSSKTVRLSASPLRIRYGGRLRAIRWRMWDVGLILAGLLHQTNSYDDQIATVRLLEKLDFTRSDEGVLKRIMENVKLPPRTPMSHLSCRTL